MGAGPSSTAGGGDGGDSAGGAGSCGDSPRVEQRRNWLTECCIRRSDGTACCDLNDSIFGEDAFYREAFHECAEGDRSHDVLFASAREQARLKMRKGSLLAHYASFELKRKANTNTEVVSNALKQCMHQPQKLEDSRTNSQQLRSPRFQLLTDLMPGNECGWLGKTITEWDGKGMPETGQGPYWSKGNGEGLKVRCGPDYRKNGKKTESVGSMYTAMSCDAVRGESKIENIIPQLMNGKLPSLPEIGGESDRGGGSALQWTKNCPLPRVICINMMLPYTTGVNPLRKDAGCSFVGFFHITPQTIKDIQSESPPAGVRLFKDFFDGPAGEPDGPNNDPNRSLLQRLNKKLKKDQQSGLFKAIAQCVNPEDVNVPDMFHTYNGKPCLITKCGYILRDPAREWLEIGMDVRGFNILARKMLCSFRHLLPRTKIHYGFLIQGIEDEEMPETVLCDMYVHGIDMLDSPVDIDQIGLSNLGDASPGAVTAVEGSPAAAGSSSAACSSPSPLLCSTAARVA